LIVGRIHVRRTDKVGAEAAFHSIDEYMMHVEDYYNTLEKRGPVSQRRVYIATDDPSVISDAKHKYVLSLVLLSICLAAHPDLLRTLPTTKKERKAVRK